MLDLNASPYYQLTLCLHEYSFAYTFLCRTRPSNGVFFFVCGYTDDGIRESSC